MESNKNNKKLSKTHSRIDVTTMMMMKKNKKKQKLKKKKPNKRIVKSKIEHIDVHLIFTTVWFCAFVVVALWSYTSLPASVHTVLYIF